jgi:gliding motility-associated-like protein
VFKNLFILILLLTGLRSLAQSNTPNIGFEDGTLKYWQCYTGIIDSLGNIFMNSPYAVAGRQTIFGKSSAGVRDPYGNFPVLCPNGSNYSLRLGNSDAGAEAERATYTFTVPNGSTYSIIFNYAVVLENPNHQPYQQPKFTALVYDVTDSKYIDCPFFDFVASSDLPGFKLSSAVGARGASIYYKEWSTATIDLRGYLGKTIRLEFTTNDCTLGAHFGYAYLDLNEAVGSPISGNTYCAGQKNITLYAPYGFASYYWYNGDLSKQIGSGQSITLSPAPPDKTTYAVKVLPYPDLGCVDTIYTVIHKIDEGFKLNVPDTIYGCPKAGVDLTAAAVTAGSSPGMKLSYFTDSLATTYLYNPDKVMTSGEYYIQGVNKEGCMNILPVHVILSIPDISVTDPQPVVFPITVDLTKTFTPKRNQTYSYYSNPAATIQVTDYTAVHYGGTYYIKAANSAGCDTIVPVKVVIHPPAPYTITAPNTFTPNSDGINDNFTVTVNGVVTFQRVSIYNRVGQLVYETKSPGEYWDGTYGGHNLPVGTYYWVFEGIDDYYRTPIRRADSITLLR